MKSKSKLTQWIMVSMVLGVIVGYICNMYLKADANLLKEVTGYLALGSDIFLRMIKMIIAPLVFATLVSGMAGLGDGKTVGRIGIKALSWFLMASVISLALGLLFVNVFQPGTGLQFSPADVSGATNLKTSALNVKSFITNIFPKSIFEAMSNNDILQILVFSLFFGFALSGLKNKTAATHHTLVKFSDELGHVMLKITGAVMLFAPIGVFSAIATAIASKGLDVLVVYGKFVGSFYVALIVLWLVLMTLSYLVLGNRTFSLLKFIREPMMLAFSTASSESAYPKTMEQLAKFGVKERLTGFVLPLGYSFNLDGSMLYQAFAAIFVAQAYGINMTLGQQITMLLVLLVSSKGMAGVPRGSLVVVAAVLPMFGLPEAGLLLIMGIDQFLDMGRTATNVLGNSIATAVVAKWEGELGPQTEEA
jgi:Na+/H+-dicarboxylate symporter